MADGRKDEWGSFQKIIFSWLYFLDLTPALSKGEGVAKIKL
jgi:hypothetical protein